tara:strand:+ start:1778 stop:2089 length:312 start_codon:yes stop_codon:yes gene_type:complete
MIEKAEKDLIPASENVAKKEQTKEYKKATTIKPHKGHTLYEYNVETKELVEATYTKTDVSYIDIQKGKNIARRRVDMKGGCVYVSALNKKNAVKKLLKSYATK